MDISCFFYFLVRMDILPTPSSYQKEIVNAMKQKKPGLTTRLPTYPEKVTNQNQTISF